MMKHGIAANFTVITPGLVAAMRLVPASFQDKED
jgi:hypothetical protein